MGKQEMRLKTGRPDEGNCIGITYHVSEGGWTGIGEKKRARSLQNVFSFSCYI